MTQTPAAARRVLTRPQDPTALFNWGKEGLPLLILTGTEDKQMLGPQLVEEMQPKFVNCTTRTFEGLGHALFYEDPDAVYSAIFDFTRTVTKANLPQSSLLHRLTYCPGTLTL